VEVAIETGDFLGGFLGTVCLAHQLQVAGQNVVIGLQLLAHELQCAMPVLPAWLVEQHDGHQRAFAGLHQCQYFQGLVEGAEAARAEHHGIGLLDEEQLAQEEEVEFQQVAGAVHHRIGALFKGQGDIESQAVFASGTFVGRGHDAATRAGNHHQVQLGQMPSQLAGQLVEGMAAWRTG